MSSTARLSPRLFLSHLHCIRKRFAFGDVLNVRRSRGKEVNEMDQAQALAIVRSLANGVDPESGEVFTPDSAYQRPQVVRALYEAAAALERIERFERRRQQMPPKTGEPWSEEEDRKLLAAFDGGRALQELAAAHERTMGAVRARLLKYGRINA
jgi:hypothetical protein